MSKILCISLSTTIQKTVTFKTFNKDKVNRSLEYVLHASGKALNTARVLNQMEKDFAQVLCPVGEKNKDLFFELASKDDMKIQGPVIPGFTRECVTAIEQETGSTTEIVVGEPSLDFDIKGTEHEILQTLKDVIADYDAVLLAGSKPSFFSYELIPAIANIVKSKNKIFMADYLGKELLNTLMVQIPDIIKINEEEYAQTFVNEEELKSSIIKKSTAFNNIIVITRGKDSTYCAVKGKFYECPSEVVKPVNTTACGDSFNAGFIYEYLKSQDIIKSLEKGTWCAARNAQSVAPGSLN